MAEPKGVGRTSAGRTRDINEDAIFVDDRLRIYAVCDGAGGHAAGDVASATCIAVVERTLAPHHELVEAVAAGREPVSAVLALLSEAVKAATIEIFELARARADGQPMATTLTVLHLTGRSAVFAHVGDTRIYRRRGSQVEQITRDHTLLERFREFGVAPPGLTEAQMAQGLTRAIGVDSEVDADQLTLDTEPGDRFVLCSDGLSRYLDGRDDLASLFDGAVETLAQELIRFALDAGGEDDVSAIAVDLPGE